jgi:hypothetical protein
MLKIKCVYLILPLLHSKSHAYKSSHLLQTYQQDVLWMLYAVHKAFYSHWKSTALFVIYLCHCLKGMLQETSQIPSSSISWVTQNFASCSCRGANASFFENVSESVATLPPFGPIEGQKWFDRISSQWESQKNRFSLIYFGKIRFLPPCIWNIPFVSYSLWTMNWVGHNHFILLQRNPPFYDLALLEKHCEITSS